jgi:hypothetical protein
MPLTPPGRFIASSFSVFKRSMMQSDQLPLADAIDADRWRQILVDHGLDFGDDEDAVYTPAITLWALISQVFFIETQRSCKAAVMRLADVCVKRAGFRTQTFTVATTITARRLDTASWIASVYPSRWLVELDIRSIKCSLGMHIPRAKSPEMVRTELWSCRLAYNLIRLKMLQSCAATERHPRSLSLATSLQLLGTRWLPCAVIGVTEELAQVGQRAPCSQRVGHRCDRVEPRANKRRPKLWELMKKPRWVDQEELPAAIGTQLRT